MLKYAANLSLLFSEFALPERFKAAKLNGFDAVEIQFPYSLTALTINRLLKQEQLKLVLFNIAADDLLQGGEGLACVPEKQAQFYAAVEQAMAYAEVLQPYAINVLPGCCHNPRRLNQYLETFKQNLAYAADVFAKLKVKVVFEAINTFDMPGFIIHNGSQMLSIMAELKHPNLLMQYDIYHMHRMQEDSADFIRLQADKIGHIQFADSPGRGQPGTGQINFHQIFAAIGQSNYKAWVAAEYKPIGDTSDSLAWLHSAPAAN
ncbi:MAG: TIM barrel protein [Methylococcaceae bacterium]|jgi:hydroxypyruvate isomerase